MYNEPKHESGAPDYLLSITARAGSLAETLTPPELSGVKEEVRLIDSEFKPLYGEGRRLDSHVRGSGLRCRNRLRPSPRLRGIPAPRCG